jgi:hypothetical protein
MAKMAAMMKKKASGHKEPDADDKGGPPDYDADDMPVAKPAERKRMRAMASAARKHH